MMDVISELDLSRFLGSYSADGRGAPAHSPVMMVSLLLYAWCRKVRSSRKIAALCHEDLGARVIVAGNLPDHRSINTFRLRHEQPLRDLFDQSVRLCQRAGMISLSETAIDGSVLRANASKHKAMSYERLVTKESQLASEIDAYFQGAREDDSADDCAFGPENAGPAVDPELQRRQGRIAKIRAAKAALEAEARAAAESKEKERAAKEANYEQSGKKLTGKKPKIDPTPKPKSQKNFTDADSRIMKNKDGGYVQGYNVQLSVDGDHQVIVGNLVSQQAADVVHLPEMVRQTIERTGFVPASVCCDAGYRDQEHVKALDEMGIIALISQGREKGEGREKGAKDITVGGSPIDSAVEPVAPLTAEQIRALTPLDRMRYRLSTEEGRAAYARRKAIVEPVYGQIKGSEGDPGFRAFLRRGREKCAAEWDWVCATHNILKYIRFTHPKQERDSGRRRNRVKSMPSAGKITHSQPELCLKAAV